MRKIIGTVLLVVGGIILITGCSESDNHATLQVMLTDAPAAYEQVLIDIQDVQIHVSDVDGEGTWQSMAVNKGLYNLLDFRNGMDTLLATMELPAGRVSQMRLVLGENNQVKTGGILFDLDTPSAQQSGLKFNIQAELSAGITYKLWIDFDAARSVIHKGNGTYSLKPVIRTFSEATSGAISGHVAPMESLPSIKAVADGDTIGTMAADNGHFLIKAVPEGEWKIIFAPVAPYMSDTVDGVDVNTGTVTEMDTVFFQQQH
jgi:hypothetical protein